ncbi:phospholipase A [Desulfogranum mediterraneum]|uniref:phospholipase A n=1 Tax=Desulfogranum mediterraneum TaxID=160661 RepID=UPI00048FA4F3|nr:phospholipase A [Desulfogranum mediterraneum]
MMLLLAGLMLLPAAGWSGTLESCMTEAIDSAEFETMTVAQLRLKCQKEISTGAYVFQEKVGEKPQLVKERIRMDREHVLQPFTLMTHKPNYMLLAAYNNSGYDATLYRQEFNEPDFDFDDTEVQFQLSIKFPLMVDLFNDTMDIYAAYTNRSFWQFYNSDESSPFRETNHEPEIWAQFHPNWEILGFTNTWNSFGIVHQSNGRGGILSRSWNRVYAWITFERDSLAFSVKPWYRLPEDDDDDDNPDITDYLGHFELSASYKWNEHVFSIMSRNNLESGFERGAVELSWSFPILDYKFLKGYVQYFNGFGESLIDYDQRVNRIGLGICLSDWL